MMSLPKVMITFAIEKKTNQLNILAQEIDPSIPMAKVYYFKELNCNNVNLLQLSSLK